MGTTGRLEPCVEQMAAYQNRFEVLEPAAPGRTAGRRAQPRAGDGHGVLATLPEQQRRVFVLRYMADLTIAEIAEHEGVPEGTVKSLVAPWETALAALLNVTGDARRR
jgi:sigma-70-like protein